MVSSCDQADTEANANAASIRPLIIRDFSTKKPFPYVVFLRNIISILWLTLDYNYQKFKSFYISKPVTVTPPTPVTTKDVETV
jgi:hypothetical protein